MKDRIHQEYRESLVPGLSEILSLSPDKIPGLLGGCLSGAGPSVLLLAESNVQEIGSAVTSIFRKFCITSTVKILRFVTGLVIEEENV